MYVLELARGFSIIDSFPSLLGGLHIGGQYNIGRGLAPQQGGHRPICLSLISRSLEEAERETQRRFKDLGSSLSQRSDIKDLAG